MEPTGWERFKYYTLGLTPAPVSRSWVERDIASRAYLVRRALQVLFGLVMGFWISSRLTGGSGWVVVGGLIGGLIGGVLQMTVLDSYVRRRALSYYRKRWDRQLSV